VETPASEESERADKAARDVVTQPAEEAPDMASHVETRDETVQAHIETAGHPEEPLVQEAHTPTEPEWRIEEARDVVAEPVEQGRDMAGVAEGPVTEAQAHMEVASQDVEPLIEEAYAPAELAPATEEVREVVSEPVEPVPDTASSAEIEAEVAEGLLGVAGEVAEELGEIPWEAVEAANELAKYVTYPEEEILASVSLEAQVVAAEIRAAAEDVVVAMNELISATRNRSAARQYPEFSFQEGFRFGCGFTLASCLIWLVLPFLAAIIVLTLLTLK
jgi:hypothetical protein